MSKKPRFKVGDPVYGKPVLAIWPGKIIEVFPAATTERKIPAYIVCFENWGKAGRYEDELYATEKEAYAANY